MQIDFGGRLYVSFPSSKAGAWVTTRIAGTTIRARGDQMAYTLPGGMYVDLQIGYVDQDGHPAAVEGDVTWETSDPAIAEVTVDDTSPQHTICRVAHGGNLGNGQITARADADLGAGVREIVTLFDVTTVAGEAVAGTITPVGEPQPIP
jgi:hypothetical protein